MANPWAIIAVVASVGKAYGTYMGGMAQKAYYDAQADVALLQYKEKRIAAKEDGVKVLEETNKALGSIIAKGAAGGLMTNEGSMLTAQMVTLREGTEDYNIALINQELMDNLGLLEFKNFKQAGKYAKKFGILNAITGLGTDIGTIGTTGAFDKTPDKGLKVAP